MLHWLDVSVLHGLHMCVDGDRMLQVLNWGMLNGVNRNRVLDRRRMLHRDGVLNWNGMLDRSYMLHWDRMLLNGNGMLLYGDGMQLLNLHWLVVALNGRSVDRYLQ